MARKHLTPGRCLRVTCICLLVLQLRGLCVEGHMNTEHQIKTMLLRNKDSSYDKTTRPVIDATDTVYVNIAMSLYHILDTNEKMQTFTTLVSIRLNWVDKFLRWDPALYQNTSSIWIPIGDIWRPDVVVFNSADMSTTSWANSKTNAIVQHDGSVLFMYQSVMKTYCTLNVQRFPFDQQYCNITFISWTYSGLQLDLTHNKSIGDNFIYYTTENQEWGVDDITVKYNAKKYACCDELYPDLVFTIHMRRRSLFYVFTLIFPCLLIYLASFMGFWVPTESGEKVNLQTTILLAFMVFLMFVGETLPPTPDAVPLLGMLFGSTMSLTSIALCFSAIVTNIHHRGCNGIRPGIFVRRLISKYEVQQVKAPNQKPMSNGATFSQRRPTLRSNGSCDEHTFEHDACEVASLTGEMNLNTESQLTAAIEWKEFASLLDRIAFWVFVVISTVAFSFVFAQVPFGN